MGKDSSIEWTDHTFNPWTGCTKVSEGCTNCYAEGWAKRSGLVQWGPKGERRRTSAANWRQPEKWDRLAAADGRRAKVFCASLADVFEDHPSIDPQWRADLWALIDATPHLDWLLLTKRPENISRLWPFGFYDEFFSWPNVWIGTTVENQEQADARIPHLMAVPAAVRFLSCEPLLGPVDLENVTHPSWLPPADDLHPEYWPVVAYDVLRGHIKGPDDIGQPKVDWVIVGGESGPKARDNGFVENARSLLIQCKASGVAFFGKQNVKKAPLPDDLIVREFPNV